MPGLDPMSVQEVVGGADEHFDVAFVQDTQQRRWVVRAPRTEVAAAHMDASLAMLSLLVRRVPFAVPAAKGFAPIPGIGRAAVHSYIPGYPLDLSALLPGHPVTAELGRTVAMIHNVDRALFDEAGLASYDAETYRRRHLAEIDRGAATGRVPAGLLARWEEALDDVRLWRFAPTPVHGALSGSDVLVTFPDRADAARATIRGVTGWEAAKVADPADDFAALVAEARPEVVDAVLTAYAHVRVERPDEHLLARARLVSELEQLATLLRAVAARDEVATEATTARLRRLDDTVHSEGASRRLRIVPAPPVSGTATTASVPAVEADAGGATPGPGVRPDRSARLGADPGAATIGDGTGDEPAAPAPAARDDDATDVIDVVAGADVEDEAAPVVEQVEERPGSVDVDVPGADGERRGLHGDPEGPHAGADHALSQDEVDASADDADDAPDAGEENEGIEDGAGDEGTPEAPDGTVESGRG